MKQAQNDNEAAVWLSPDDLTPWNRNPRHNEHAVQQVADSIARFGFAAPIVARAEDRRVIAGHTRLLAAQRLGMTKVPVRLLDVSDAEADALALADNKLAELADWDDAALSDVLAGLDDLAGLGWTDDELNNLLADTEDALPPHIEDPGIDVDGMTFAVMVTATSEADQEQVFRRISDMLGSGYEIRALCV